MKAQSPLRALALSRWLARLFALICFLVPVALVVLGTTFVVMYDQVFASLQVQGLDQMAPPHLDVARRWLLVGTVGLYCAPLVVAAAYLRRLFESFASNVIFTMANVARLRAIGRWLFVAAVATNLSNFLFLAISMHPREGFHLTILPLLYAAVIYVIAHVLEEANRMADDNAKFV
jgi:hypothetical protein